MYYQSRPLPSVTPEATPDRGPSPYPNPGERSSQEAALGVPTNSVGLIPSRGNRAGGGQQIDLGARVGIMHNLEFSAGGRSHRLSTGTFGHAAPSYDPKTGHLHTSTASESGEPTLGPAFGKQDQPAMEPHVSGAGATNDKTTPGDTGPGRRRDTRTP